MTRRRIADSVFILAALLLAEWLRLRALGVPSLWLDEIVDFEQATRLSWARWLGLSELENGPIFYATELAGRVCRSIEVSARIGPALFGIGAVLLAWFAARAIASHAAAAYVFPLLLAGSPLHVYYSREARQYSLVILLITAVLAALLWCASLRVLVPLLLAAVYSSAIAAPALISVGLAALLALVIDRERRRPWFLAAFAAGAGALLILLLYHPARHAAPEQFPPINAAFFKSILQSFSVVALDTSHIHRAGYVFFAFAVIGAVDLMRRDRVKGIVVVAMALLPAAITLLALWRMQHFYAVRYVATSLPAYLLLVAVGIAAVAQPGRLRPLQIPIAVVIALLCVREGLSAARREPFQKLDWKSIASTIADHAQSGDVVLTTNDWSLICARFYLPPRIRVVSANESVPIAASVVKANSPVWIVAAGFHTRSDIVDWTCRYPVLLGSPLESFRLHYAPDITHFIEHRSVAPEWRAILAAQPDSQFTIDFSPEAGVFLRSGWGGPEPEENHHAQWAVGRSATVELLIDEPGDRRMVFHAKPFYFRGSAPQRAIISLNGTRLTELQFDPDWTTYHIDVPRARWRAGANVLSFEFSRANAPASLDPTSHDQRSLSVRFDAIAVLPMAGHPAPFIGAVPVIRLQGLIDENSVWRGTAAPPPGNWNRAALRHLLGRLGYDPVTVLPEVLRGSVTVEQLAYTLATDSPCVDDSQFLRTAYWAVLGRPIDAVGERDFGGLLWKGVPRRDIIRAIIDSDEFRAMLRSR